MIIHSCLEDWSRHGAKQLIRSSFHESCDIFTRNYKGHQTFENNGNSWHKLLEIQHLNMLEYVKSGMWLKISTHILQQLLWIFISNMSIACMATPLYSFVNIEILQTFMLCYYKDFQIKSFETWVLIVLRVFCKLCSS